MLVFEEKSEGNGPEGRILLACDQWIQPQSNLQEKSHQGKKMMKEILTTFNSYVMVNDLGVT